LHFLPHSEARPCWKDICPNNITSNQNATFFCEINFNHNLKEQHEIKNPFSRRGDGAWRVGIGWLRRSNPSANTTRDRANNQPGQSHIRPTGGNGGANNRNQRLVKFSRR
jgi:hypothetical protein